MIERMPSLRRTCAFWPLVAFFGVGRVNFRGGEGYLGARSRAREGLTFAAPSEEFANLMKALMAAACSGVTLLRDALSTKSEPRPRLEVSAISLRQSQNETRRASLDSVGCNR